MFKEKKTAPAHRELAVDDILTTLKRGFVTLSVVNGDGEVVGQYTLSGNRRRGPDFSLAALRAKKR